MSQTKFPIFPIPNLRTLEARILEVLLDLPSHLRIPYRHIYLFSKCYLFCFPKYSSIRFPFYFGNNNLISFLRFFFFSLSWLLTIPQVLLPIKLPSLQSPYVINLTIRQLSVKYFTNCLQCEVVRVNFHCMPTGHSPSHSLACSLYHEPYIAFIIPTTLYALPISFHLTHRNSVLNTQRLSPLGSLEASRAGQMSHLLSCLSI